MADFFSLCLCRGQGKGSRRSDLNSQVTGSDGEQPLTT